MLWSSPQLAPRGFPSPRQSPQQGRAKTGLNPQFCGGILAPAVNISKILANLRREREQAKEAILNLEELVASAPLRRSRWPVWFRKRSDGPEGSGGGSPAEGAGVR